MTFPFSFIILNFILIIILLTNKYLLTASLISIILILSRLTILIADDYFPNFMANIGYVENITANETIKPTWLNSQIVGIRLTQSFDDWETYGQREKNNH